MRGRQVEVAVGLPDHTWKDVWVSVPENPNHVLDLDELAEAAKKLALDLAKEACWRVTFVHIIYMEPLKGNYSPNGDH